MKNVSVKLTAVAEQDRAMTIDQKFKLGFRHPADSDGTQLSKCLPVQTCG